MESYKITTFVNGPKLKLQTRKIQEIHGQEKIYSMIIFYYMVIRIKYYI